jgi:hypothetical protein
MANCREVSVAAADGADTLTVVRRVAAHMIQINAAAARLPPTMAHVV